MNFIGIKIFRTVQGHKIFAAHELVGFQVFPPLQLSKIIREDFSQFIRRRFIQNISKLGVLGDGGHVEGITQVIHLYPFLHPFLEFEQGRVLKEHHRKTAHTAIMD